MRSHHDWSRAPLNLVLAGMIALSAILLSSTGMLTTAEDSLAAHRAEFLNREPSGQTVIVEIDANSLAQLRTWPWPRRYHAQLVRELHKAGASVIGFDVDFSARSGSDDLELASAMQDAGYVVIPIFQQKSSDRANDRRILASRPDPAFKSAWVGGVNIFPGQDGMVRDYPAATLIDGAVQPSLATLIAEKNGLGDRLFQPDWAIDARHIQRFSFVDVINGRVPYQAIRNKRVLIGATAIELGDRYAVPRYGVVSGVVVQALATESLLQDRAIQPTGMPITVLGAFLIGLLLKPRPIIRTGRFAILYGGIALAILVGPILVQMAWPIAVSSAAWLYTLVASAAAQAVVESRRRLRWRTQFDIESGLPNRLTLEKALAAGTDSSIVLVVAAIERFEAIRDGIGISATNEIIRSSADLFGRLVEQPIYRIAPDTLALFLANYFLSVGTTV